MSSSIFFGGSVLAAVIAGTIALFAPCCISVMLPAYFASSFQNRRLLVAMTFLFAAGIATVILPIAMGASVLQQLLTTQHTAIYVTGGLLMLALAGYVLLGGQIHLPMPGRRAGGKTGILSVYSLGIFSGVASSCCAPVLAGVIALSTGAWLGLCLWHGGPAVCHRAALGSLRLAGKPPVPAPRIHLEAGSFDKHAHRNEPGQRHLARTYRGGYVVDRAGLPFHAAIGGLADTAVREPAACRPGHDQRPRLDSELDGRAHLPRPPWWACLVRTQANRGANRR